MSATLTTTSQQSELQPSKTSGLSQQLESQVFWQELDNQSSRDYLYAMIYCKLARMRQ